MAISMLHRLKEGEKEGRQTTRKSDRGSTYKAFLRGPANVKGQARGNNGRGNRGLEITKRK